MSGSSKPVDPNLVSLTRFVDHPDLLAEHTMNSVEWEAVEVLMPRILRGKAKEDVKQLLLAEIDGMSKKRLMAVLAGETLEESSSSEEEEEEEVVEKDMEEQVEEQGTEEVVKSSANVTSESSENVSESERVEDKAPETSPEPMEQDERNHDEEDAEEGEVEDDEPNRSITPPDPSPSIPERRSEEVDSDEEIDRQLNRDLEDFI